MLTLFLAVICLLSLIKAINTGFLKRLHLCVCRRQDQVHTHNGDRQQVPNGDIGMDIGHLQLGAQKRGASPMTESVTDDERVAKRSRRVSGQSEGARHSGETHGVRNPIDVSYSSSRRWFDRKVSVCHCVCHCVSVCVTWQLSDLLMCYHGIGDRAVM